MERSSIRKMKELRLSKGTNENEWRERESEYQQLLSTEMLLKRKRKTIKWMEDAVEEKQARLCHVGSSFLVESILSFRNFPSVQITFPGLRMFNGSNAFLIAFIASMPGAPNSSIKSFFLPRPTPCSPVTVPLTRNDSLNRRIERSVSDFHEFHSLG